MCKKINKTNCQILFRTEIYCVSASSQELLPDGLKMTLFNVQIEHGQEVQCLKLFLKSRVAIYIIDL